MNIEAYHQVCSVCGAKSKLTFYTNGVLDQRIIVDPTFKPDGAFRGSEFPSKPWIGSGPWECEEHRALYKWEKAKGVPKEGRAPLKARVETKPWGLSVSLDDKDIVELLKAIGIGDPEAKEVEMTYDSPGPDYYKVDNRAPIGVTFIRKDWNG